MKISQSFINDVVIGDPKDPRSCPRYLNFKYVQGKDIKVSPAMLAGRYFEWHLLGATRDGIEPVIPRVGVKDLRPPKSAAKSTILEYLRAKKQTCFDTDTKEALLTQVAALPPDLTLGTPSEAQQTLDVIIGVARQILFLMGLDTSKGEKQAKLETATLVGHIDWITHDFKDPSRKAIYDVKWTETKIDDRWNGWGDFDVLTNPKTQAAQYIRLYHELTGEWIPFYFLLFAKSGWVRFLKITLTEGGLFVHQQQVEHATERIEQFTKTKWKGTPEFNKCINCPFADICPERAVLPTLEEFEI